MSRKSRLKCVAKRKKKKKPHRERLEWDVEYWEMKEGESIDDHEPPQDREIFHLSI